MEPTLQALIDRLNQLSDQFRELRDGVQQTILIADLAPEMALTRARKVLEYVVREVFERRVKEPPGTRPLENLLDRLVKDGHFPVRLDAYAAGVRKFGNVGTHNFSERITAADVYQSLTQLMPILEWYFEEERPDAGVSLGLPQRQEESIRSKPVATVQSNKPETHIAVVSKGLRSFDANDAKSFLELLPGPRDEERLPESIQFWKQRIEATNHLTFTVGLIYGPSGCGKSSLMKAGLLPRLADRIRSVYIEATAEGTEARLLRGLREQCPQLPDNLDLTGTIAVLRQGKGLGERQKVFVVLDQFEQWLHAKRQEENTELVKALRQCDGKRVQAVVMVRDDFWLAVSRFLAAVEVDLVAGQNIALVDLFDLRHAQKVLTAFGRAFGALADKLPKDQQAFLDHAVAGLAQDGRVISVRLALFADMVKSKPWTLATLKEVGGTEGVGVTFLEETFSAPSANPKHRLHQKAARAVLKALLPEQGTDIKGIMRSHQELLEASGYADHLKDFDDLLRILDGEVRLITPTDPEGIGSDSPSAGVQTGHRYYQLTHDYLVHSLRDWLTRKQKETRRGRAELRLADRAGLWKEKRENRHLPSLWEFLNIRLLTDKKKWTEPQQKMMDKAGRFHGIRTGIAAGVLIALTLSGVAMSREIDQKRQADYAAALVKRLVAADISEVPGIVQEVDGNRRWTDPLLRQEYAKSAEGSNQKLHLALALLSVKEGTVDYLRDQLLVVTPRELSIVRDALLAFKESVAEPLWNVALDTKREPPQRFQAACALATYAPDDQRWSLINTFVAGRLVTLDASALVAWREALRPAKKNLIDLLVSIFRDATQKELARIYATETLADYASDRPAELFNLLVDSELFQFPSLFDKLARHKDKAIALAQDELKRLPSERVTEDQKELLAKRQANAAVGLFRLGMPEITWPLLKFSPDPRVRSYIIHWLGPLEADPLTVMQRLCTEPDVTIRRALVLTLGEFTEQQLLSSQRRRGTLSAFTETPLSSAQSQRLIHSEFSRTLSSSIQRQPLIEKLLAVYENEPDAGLHSAVEWLLRQWGQGKRLEAVIEKLKSDEKQLQAGKSNDKRHWFINKQKQTFVIVDSGEFLMGSPETEPDRYPNESQHRCRIGRRFAIATTEITKEQFGRFQSARPDIAKMRIGQWVKTEDSPQVHITWYEAAAYCDWLSEQEGIPKEQWCYQRNEHGQYAAGMKAKENHLELTGYRLPTEAEWEFACRAGTVTSRYYGLTERLLPNYAWYVTGGQNRTWPVRSLKPNDFGLYDMLGNAYEWCFDLYIVYPERSDKVFDDMPPTQPIEAGDRRVLRGGAFTYPAVNVRSADRIYFPPDLRNYFIGFRIARTYPRAEIKGDGSHFRR
jgi:eukaryotic-like serine/threonine-protein kinase